VKIVVGVIELVGEADVLVAARPFEARSGSGAEHPCGGSIIVVEQVERGVEYAWQARAMRSLLVATLPALVCVYASSMDRELSRWSSIPVAPVGHGRVESKEESWSGVALTPWD